MPFDFRGGYDENWPLPETLTMEEYSHVLFRPDAHLGNGRVVARQLGSYDLSRMVGRLIELLSEPLRSKGCQLCVSLRLRVSATRIRVCDFVALKPGAPREDVPTVAPLVCIEVLEHCQQPEDELETMADYQTMESSTSGSSTQCMQSYLPTTTAAWRRSLKSIWPPMPSMFCAGHLRPSGLAGNSFQR